MGKCGSYDCVTGKLPIPCVNDKNFPPKKFQNSTLAQRLQELCIDLVTDEPLCCDEDQATSFISQIENTAEPILSRCPSCFANFANIVCQMTCSPNQKAFLRVDKAQKSQDKPGSFYLDTISYAIKEEYAQTFFNSCVHVPLFLDVFPGSFSKDAHGVLSNIGFKSNIPFGGNSPFQVNYVYYPPGETSTTLRPLDSRYYRCSEAPSSSHLPCSCSDCPDVCEPLPPPPQSHPFTIFGIDGMIIVMSVLFTLSAFMVIFTFYRFERAEQQDDGKALFVPRFFGIHISTLPNTFHF